MSHEENKTYKRKYIRFTPDDNTIVECLIDDRVIKGVALTEAYGGCSAVFAHNSEHLKPDMIVTLVVGNMNISSAQVKWTKMHTDLILEAGFQYLDE